MISIAFGMGRTKMYWFTLLMSFAVKLSKNIQLRILMS